jgi:hypothetical protein
MALVMPRMKKDKSMWCCRSHSDGSDSVVSFSAASLLISAGKEENEAHPPIRRVRGLTPTEDKRSHPSERDAESDSELEKHLRRPRAREQLRMEIQRLTTAR